LTKKIAKIVVFAEKIKYNKIAENLNKITIYIKGELS